MKVSIVMITYNHARFIEKALDSALAQETDFPFEIIIGEDDSPDGTRDIVLRYKELHPDKIVLNLRKRSDTLSRPNETPGTRNFTQSVGLARGKYISILEGDDYWTDPRKLARQVAVLDAAPDVAICCHGVEILYDDNRESQIAHSPWTGGKRGSLDEILRGNLIQTASVMYRNGVIKEYPEWYHIMPAPDWASFVMILDRTKGAIKYLDEVMAVHRIHAAGQWGQKSREQACESTVRSARVLDEGLGYKYHRELTQAISAALNEKSELCEKRGDYRAALGALYRVWYLSGKLRYLPFSRFMRLHLRALSTPSS